MMKARRKRNRKKRVDGYLFPVPFASLLVFAGLAALSYLWMLSRCEAIGAEIKALERADAELTERYLNEELKWTRMRSPQNLDRILARNGVKMDWPSGRQVVLMADAGLWAGGDGPDSLMPEARQYAGVPRTERHE
jgi:hypothetical protein